MPDVNGGTDTNEAARNETCLACPVRAVRSRRLPALCQARTNGSCWDAQTNAHATKWHSALSPLLQINTYQPAMGQASCILCPAGSSTDATGNTECKPCPFGYYSPSTSTACIAAPQGTYVNTTGATTSSPW